MKDATSMPGFVGTNPTWRGQMRDSKRKLWHSDERDFAIDVGHHNDNQYRRPTSTGGGECGERFTSRCIAREPFVQLFDPLPASHEAFMSIYPR